MSQQVESSEPKLIQTFGCLFWAFWWMEEEISSLQKVHHLYLDGIFTKTSQLFGDGESYLLEIKLVSPNKAALAMIGGSNKSVRTCYPLWVSEPLSSGLFGGQEWRRVLSIGHLETWTDMARVDIAITLGWSSKMVLSCAMLILRLQITAECWTFPTK